MKNLIINIYKTLFFFDLSIVIAYYLPSVKTKNAAVSNLWREGVFFTVMLIFTLLFKTAVEHNRLKIFNTANKFRHYSIGLITGITPLVLTVLPLLLTLFDNFIVGEKPAAVLAKRLHRRVKNRKEKRRSAKNADETEEDADEGGDPYEDEENEAAASREDEPEMTDREGMEGNGDETEK